MRLAQREGRTALVVVDMHQYKYYPSGEPISGKRLKRFFHNDKVTGRVCKAIRKAKEAGVPVVLVSMKSERLHPAIDAVAGPDSMLVKRVEKEHCDSFRETGLERLLGDWNVKNLVVCGYSWRVSKFGKACVASTVDGAKEKGFHAITAYPLMYGWTNGIAELIKTVQHYRNATEHYFSEKRLIERMLPLAGAKRGQMPLD